MKVIASIPWHRKRGRSEGYYVHFMGIGREAGGGVGGVKVRVITSVIMV